MASVHPIQSSAHPAQAELEQHDRPRHRRADHHRRIDRKAGICQGLGNVPDQARHLVGNGCHLKTFDGPLCSRGRSCGRVWHFVDASRSWCCRPWRSPRACASTRWPGPRTRPSQAGAEGLPRACLEHRASERTNGEPPSHVRERLAAGRLQGRGERLERLRFRAVGVDPIAGEFSVLLPLKAQGRTPRYAELSVAAHRRGNTVALAKPDQVIDLALVLRFVDQHRQVLRPPRRLHRYRRA